MGAITVCIPDELEIAFRRIIRIKYGDKQGDFQEELLKPSSTGAEKKALITLNQKMKIEFANK